MKTTTEIKHLKPGGFVLIDDVPCKVDKVQASSSGKHGHSKVRLDAKGIMDGRSHSIVKPSDETVSVPIMTKHTAQVLAIVGDNAQLMDMETYATLELPVPEELKGKLQAGQEISYFEIAEQKTLKQLK